MNRFYLIDKPLGISSFDVIRQLRKKLNIRKMGHTGTLDPLASGCMLIATGSYTKLIPYLEKSRKTYCYRVELNGSTISGDLAEEINFISADDQEKSKKNITKQLIESIIQDQFLGNISQIPPQFSALKIDGKRAYELARAGKEIQMKKRELEVFSHTVLGYTYPSVDLEVEVSAGAYVRSLAVDIGEALGVAGYVSKLRRTGIGKLDISQAVTLDELTKESYFPIEKLFDPDSYVTDLSSHNRIRLSQGLPRIGEFNLQKNKPYFVFDGEAITNIIEYDGTELKPLKNIN